MKPDPAGLLRAWAADQQVLAEPGAGVGDGGPSGQSPLPSCMRPYLPTATGLQVQPVTGSPPCWPPPSPSLHPTLNSQAEQGREQQIRNQHRGASPRIPSPSRSRSLSEAAFSSGSHRSLCSQQLPSWAFRPPVQRRPLPRGSRALGSGGAPSLPSTGGAHLTGPDAAPGPVPTSPLVTITAPPGVLTALRGAGSGRPRPSGMDSVSEPAFIS